MNPVLSSVWFNDVVGMALFVHPVIFPEEGVHVQVNCVPAMFDVRIILVG